MADGVQKIPTFSIRFLDLMAKANGRPLFLVTGDYPSWEDLMDWRLIAWVEAPDKLVFGGANPNMISDGNELIYEFFRAAELSPAVLGWIDAAMFSQVVFMNDNGHPERLFCWTFISADVRNGDVRNGDRNRLTDMSVAGNF